MDHTGIQDYGVAAAATNQFKTSADARFQLRYGYFGEVGSVLSAVKKVAREEIPHAEANVVEEELGDALWYLAALTAAADIEFEHVVKVGLAKVMIECGHVADVPKSVTLSEIDDSLAAVAMRRPPRHTALCQLGADSGELMRADVGAIESESFSALLSQQFAALLLVALSLGLSFARIAERNLRKIESRWPPANAKPVLPDFSGIPEHEQLPVEMDIVFREFTIGSSTYVTQQWKGINLGDRLTDNRFEQDDYRFHDVFHLAYVAHLSWSPVIRALLRLKRKSKPQVDENEDGARAIVIEEAVTAMIFNHVHTIDPIGLLHDTAPGKLQYDLLKGIKQLVSGYEVERCALWQWEHAILDGFAAFRQLKRQRKGLVHVNRHKCELRFEPVG